MAKVRTVDDLSTAITSDFLWRIKEISDFKGSTFVDGERQRTALLRAGVPILYAHWEGHISVITRRYSEFVSAKRLRYSDLRSSFLLHELGRRFDQLFGKRLTRAEKVELIDEIITSKNVRFGKLDGDLLKANSNLNSEVLCDICVAINIESGQFREDFDFIDKILVNRRNHIAHGQDVQIESSDFEIMVERTIGLMRKFRNSVENAAITDEYRV